MKKATKLVEGNMYSIGGSEPIYEYVGIFFGACFKPHKECPFVTFSDNAPDKYRGCFSFGRNEQETINLFNIKQ